MDLRQAVAITAVAIAPFASAQEADNLKGETELGVLITSGTTEETNIKGRLGLLHEVESWRNSGEFRTNYSETEDETTTEKYLAELETNYKFDKNQYWFLRGSYEDDRFSGYDFESTVTTGYGNRVWNSGERSFLDLSVGGGYRYNRLEMVTPRARTPRKKRLPAWRESLITL